MVCLHTPDELKQCGVYAIVRDGEIYIGSTQKSFRKRLSGHLCDLRRGKHPNHRLQNIFSKHGEAVFAFKILETCNGNPVPAEQKWIDHYAAIKGRGLLNAKLIAYDSNIGCNDKQQGENSPSSKLSNSDVLTIKNLLSQDVSNSEIARRYGMTARNISSIRLGQTWASVGDIIPAHSGVRKGDQLPQAKLTSELATNIKQALADGAEIADVSSLFNVPRNTVAKIKRTDSWSHILPELNQHLLASVKRKITRSIAVQVTDLLKQKVSVKDVCGRLSLSKYTVEEINRGGSWRCIHDPDTIFPLTQNWS